MSLVIEALGPPALTAYGKACGWTLARAHARSGDRIAISAYLGKSDPFDRAIASFAETYADQNERDFASLQAAVVGRVKAEMGLLRRLLLALSKHFTDTPSMSANDQKWSMRPTKRRRGIARGSETNGSLERFALAPSARFISKLAGSRPKTKGGTT